MKEIMSLCLQEEEILAKKWKDSSSIRQKSESLQKERSGKKYLGENYRKVEFCRS